MSKPRMGMQEALGWYELAGRPDTDVVEIVVATPPSLERIGHLELYADGRGPIIVHTSQIRGVLYTGALVEARHVLDDELVSRIREERPDSLVRVYDLRVEMLELPDPECKLEK